MWERRDRISGVRKKRTGQQVGELSCGQVEAECSLVGAEWVCCTDLEGHPRLERQGEGSRELPLFFK